MHSTTIPTPPQPPQPPVQQPPLPSTQSSTIPSVSVVTHHIRNPSNSSFHHLHHSTTNSSSTTSPISTSTVLIRNPGNNHSNSPNDNTSFNRNPNQLSTPHNPQQTNQSSTNSVNKPEKQSTGYHHNVPVQQQTQQPPPGHSFLSAVSEVKNMENALLGLLAAFNSGELSAFGSGRTLETMEAIRAKQERLARLHFDLASGVNADDRASCGKDPPPNQNPTSPQKQSQSPTLKPPEKNTSPNNSPNNQNNPQQEPQTSTSSTPWMSESDQNKLVAGLRELSIEIEKLHEHESNVKHQSQRGSTGGVKDVE